MKRYLFTTIALLIMGIQGHSQQSHQIKKLFINSNQSDFGVSFYGKDQVVFASSRKWKGEKTRSWSGNGQPFLDLYLGDLTPDGEIDHLRKFGGRYINTPYHESNAVFTKDTSVVYFTRNNFIKNKVRKDDKGYSLIQLYKAHVAPNGEWVDVTPMPFNSDDYQTGHPALNAAENKLYFTSDMPGSYGKTDIFVVDILSDGTYGTPKNLGPEVNTRGTEMFPFVDQENNLFFASDGLADNLGGLDIYVSKLEGDRAVGLAVNLGSPLNGPDDDFALVKKPGTDWGYFSSDREKSNVDNIYMFQLYDGFMASVADNGKCINVFEGEIREEGTNALLPGALVKVYDAKGKLLETIRANEYAKYTFRLDCGLNDYKIVASKEHYKDDQATFKGLDKRVPGGVNLADFNLALSLKPEDFIKGYGDYLMVDNLNPIYFDLDKSNIRPDAAIELEKVVRIMKKYKEIQIEVAAHTDSRANDQYNMELSDRRAQSTKDWLIKRGIDPSRVSGKGYGETQLVNDCGNGVSCSEAEHQLNRRTEFVLKNPEALRNTSEKE